MNEMLECVESGAGALLTASLVSAGLALVVFILEVSLRQWRLQRLFYGLWFLVAIRLMLFVVPASSVSILNVFASDNESSLASVAYLVPGQVNSNASKWRDVQLSSFGHEKTVAYSLSNSIKQSLLMSLFTIWSFVVFLLLLRTIAHLQTIRKMIVGSNGSISRQLEVALADGMQILKMRQRVRLRVSEDCEVPAVVGLIRPTVLIPDWCQNELTPEQLKLVVLHELIHVRRGDLFVQLFSHWVTLVHWFNPLAYFAATRLAQWREVSCDQQVLAVCGSSQRDLAKTYGLTILQIAARYSSVRKYSGLIPGFIGATSFRCDTWQLVERIQMLEKKTHCSWSATLLTGLLVSFLVAVGFTSAQEPTSSTVTICQPTRMEVGVTVENTIADSVANQSLAIQLKICTGDVDEVNSLISKLTGKPADGFGGRMVEIGAEKSPLRERFEQLLHESDVTQEPVVTLVSLNGRAAEYLSGGEVPFEEIKPDGSKSFRFVPFGRQAEITPFLNKGVSILQIKFAETEKPTGEEYWAIESDGTQVRQRNMHTAEIQTTIKTQPRKACVVFWPTIDEGKSAFAIVETWPIEVVQLPAVGEKLPIR